MRKQIFLFAFILAGIFCNQSYAQLYRSSENPPVYRFGITNRPPIIAPGIISTVSDTSYTGDRKRTVLWCEYGDGGFTTDSLSTSDRHEQKKYNTLLLASTIYDTTKDGLARFASFDYIGRTRTISSDNDISLTVNGSPVAITPSMRSIVSGDTMVFAVTYKLPVTDKETPDPPEFALVFLYSDSIFGKLEANEVINVGDTVFSSVRTAHDEEVSFLMPDAILSKIPDASNYNSYVIFGNLRDLESNVFVTLRPGDSIPLGMTGSVKAVLIQIDSDDTTLTFSNAGEATIDGMPVARAHDPNYINQEDRCITTPKNNTLIRYHIHFQNDGAGEADAVIVKVALPDKIRFSDLTFIKASIGGRPAQRFTLQEGRTSDSAIFRFDNIWLRGTNNNPTAFSNSNTMGDIYFTVRANSDLADTIYSRAAIYFHSYQSGAGDWESPVFTEVAVSYFSKCCGCPSPFPPPSSCCKKILHLCWWWWILIAIGIIITWWLIAGRRKRKKKEPLAY